MKKIINFLHIILEHKTNDIILTSKRISELNHQIKHFDDMHEIYQKEVIDGLIKDIKKFQKNSDLNWDNMLEQLEELKTEQ